MVFQYQRLPNIYFHRGHLDHTVKFCSLLSPEITQAQSSSLLYGPFCHAPISKFPLLIEHIPIISMETKACPPSSYASPHTHDNASYSNYHVTDELSPFPLAIPDLSILVSTQIQSHSL